ncbi:MAG: hypothetical protein AB8E74_07750 [Prochlorococcus sp.]|nr:hypothetical protein [Prochlorococcaceae cyanobacterium Fu_MAG_50]
MASNLHSLALKPSKGFARLLTPFLLLAFPVWFEPAQAQVSSPTMTKQERDIYRTSPGQGDEDNVLNSTNPLDLMNRLRRATAMDDATTPEDAIDAALKAYETDGSFSAQ